jgi:uncharacterized protein (DUF433 family)
MKSTVKSIRVDPATVDEIERLRRGKKTTFSALAGELLSEAAKMRRCPGIVFCDGPAGRRARIEGTGIDVWEVVASYLAVERDEQRLKAAYHWLSERQILAALGYFRAYPDEIQGMVDENQAGPDDVEHELPFARRHAR